MTDGFPLHFERCFRDFEHLFRSSDKKCSRFSGKTVRAFPELLFEVVRNYCSRFGGTYKKNKDYYKTIAIGVALEVFKVGDEVVYVPKIKQYRINFNRENSKFSSACVSYEMVDIHFEYRYAANVFDYEALEDPEIKKDFDDFIQGQRKAQIAEATTFFNDDFPVMNPEV